MTNFRPFAPFRSFVLAGLVSIGCGDIQSSRPPEHCSKAHEKCTLPSGVLGICDFAGEPTGQGTPQLVCRSQH